MKFRIRKGNDRFGIEVDCAEPSFNDLLNAITRQCGSNSPFTLSLNGRDPINYADVNEPITNHGLRSGDLLYVIGQADTSVDGAAIRPSVADKSTFNGVQLSNQTDKSAVTLLSVTDNNTGAASDAHSKTGHSTVDQVGSISQSNSLLKRVESLFASNKVDAVLLATELIAIAMKDCRCRFGLHDRTVLSRSTTRLVFKLEPINATDNFSTQKFDDNVGALEAPECEVEILLSTMSNETVICFARSASTSQPTAVSCSVSLAPLAAALRDFQSASGNADSKAWKRSKSEASGSNEVDAASRLNARLSQLAMLFNSLLFSKLFDALSAVIGGPRRLDQLDGYTLQNICEYLDCLSLLRLGKTCRRLHEAAGDNRVWHKLTRRDFYQSTTPPVYSPQLDWRAEYKKFYAERKQNERQKALAMRVPFPGPLPFPSPRGPFSPFAPLAPPPLPISPILDDDPYGASFSNMRPIGPARPGLPPLGGLGRPRRFDDGSSFL